MPDGLTLPSVAVGTSRELPSEYLAHAAAEPVAQARGPFAAARTMLYPEIDRLKAVSILVVVLIHAMSGDRMFHKDLLVEQVLSELCLFAVPAFLFAAGFLFDKDRRTTAELSGKLAKRIVLPYLACSLVFGGGMMVYALWQQQSPPFTPGGFLKSLALGKVIGIYYFVFVIGYLYAFGLWLRRLPARAVDVLCAVSALLLAGYSLGLFDRLGPLGRLTSYDLMFRHPIRHLFPFLAGWVVSVRYHKLRPWLAARTGVLLSLLITAEIAVLSVLIATAELNEARSPVMRLGMQVQIILVVATILLTGLRRPVNPRLITSLSSASYAIYLLHMPILRAVQVMGKQLQMGGFSVRMLLVWPVSLAATLLLIWGIRRLIKNRASLLIGY